jgi:hypothetical protein
MSQVNGTDQQFVDNETQPELHPDPNQLVAMSLYYPPLVPALVGLCVVVLVAVFSRDFPSGFLFWSDFSLQGIIAALSVLSAFLFLEAARMGFFAHANDLYGMDKERRKSIFRGNDPFQEGLQNTPWFNWQVIKEKAEVITKRYLLRAAGYFILGLVTLYLSVSFLLASYILWLGIGAFVLTCVYAVFQFRPLIGMIKEYRRFTKRFRKLEDIQLSVDRPRQVASPTSPENRAQ